VTGGPADPARTGVATLLTEALDRVGGFPPGRRAPVDQNTAILRARLARAGLPITPLTVAAFLAGVAELHYKAAHTTRVRSAAVSLRPAAAQLLLPGACPGCVADLDHALTTPRPNLPGAWDVEGRSPRGGGIR
jgi:hypothetical protein